MANPYTSVSISGYNATPPSDDGTVADSNKVNWSKHKDKLGDPVKTLAESMDTNILAAFVKRFGNTVTALAGDHTLVAGNEGAVLSFTGTRTLTLMAAATATSGFIFAAQRAGTGDITITPDGSETIDGAANLVLTDQHTSAILITDGSNWITIAKPQTTLPTSHIGGMTTSNGTDADHDIDIAVGSCRDAADSENLILSSILVKQIDAAWAVGSAAGGLDTGAVAQGLYAMWAIKDITNNIVDVLFSLSFTAPTMPSGYTVKRLFWAVVTDSSANILPYSQQGDHCEMVDHIADVAAQAISNNTYITGTTFSVPPNCIGDFIALLLNASETATSGRLSFRPAASSAAASQAGSTVMDINNTATFDGMGTRVSMKVDSSSTFDFAGTEGAGAAAITISTLGWTMLTRSEP